MSCSGFAGWFSGTPPANLGAAQGRLAPCPDKSNCVSSQESGASYVAAFPFSGSPAAALEELKRILAAMPRTRLVVEAPGYLRAEFASRVFGFVDDLELLVDFDAAVIHVRSASRLGYSDFGVNRKRVEVLRAAFNAAQAAR